MKGKLFPAVVVCLFLVFAANAQTKITVNEEKSSIVIDEQTADVVLVLNNNANSFNDRITLEILDAENNIRSQTSQSHLIKKGENIYKLALPLGDLLKNADDRFAWYRLRYRAGNASGVISLSELIEDIFRLRVIATDNLFSGMVYRTRIRATNPFNERTVSGVKLSAEIEVDLKGTDDKKLKLTATGETDTEGFAVLDFQIPTEAELDDDAEIKITGKKGGIIREASEDLNIVTNDLSFLILTDKPIYQPEQTLNLRGILLKGAEAKTVVSGEEIEFRIEDEDNTVLYRENLKTSEFGIAAMSWTIPGNAKLGNYSIEVRRDGEQIGYQRVKVLRYDLPNFAVSAKPGKPYYLPNEKKAEIEIRADYLFGKPVTKGKVRVARENSREWNWKEQKYDVDEGEVREGEIDGQGKFIAKFDLSEAHENLKDDEWRKFRDINFAAYFTDLTTNKTEQKRFDVRVTKEAIHVYFIGERYNQHPDLPVDAFVSTFYADGSPAACDVEIKGSEEDEDKFKTLLKIKTNSFGVGKADFKRPKFEDEDTDLDLKIIAKDSNGKTGTYEDDLDFDDDDTLKIKTDKSIYKPGETVKVKINSNIKTGLVYIDVVKGWSVVESSFVNLRDGKAELKIPFQNDFQGEIKIAAFYEDEDEELTNTSRGIIFPSPQNLKLDAEFEKAVYKPGEEAVVSFSVVDNIGKSIESALGVVVIDRAVEERAKTDSDFGGGMFRNFSGWLGYGDSFGSINVKDLNDLDLSKPIPDELQLVADVMLYDSYYNPNIFHIRNYPTDAKSVSAEFFNKQLEPLAQDLNET
ncbi:MAG: MG2 domain-containing protein, partial [Pyrinomonadaceae bacterium]